VVEHREDAADGDSEDGEYEDREVALEHWVVGVFVRTAPGDLRPSFNARSRCYTPTL
jgi:hypothetical protein